MTRRERYARSEFAPWPDEGLREAAKELTWPFFILRTDLRHHHSKSLIVDVGYEGFQPLGDPSVPVSEWPRYHSRALRLTWEGHIFALESYEEFYAGPIFAAEKGYQAARAASGPFVEIVSDPDPWIEQILEQNGNVDVFPPYGEPVLDWETGKGTGRFFPSDARLEDSGKHPAFFWAGETAPTPEQRAEFETEVARRKEEMRQQMLAKPRYRHLLIISESHFLEILCEDLPRWEWVTVAADED